MVDIESGPKSISNELVIRRHIVNGIFDFKILSFSLHSICIIVFDFLWIQ